MYSALPSRSIKLFRVGGTARHAEASLLQSRNHAASDSMA